MGCLCSSPDQSDEPAPSTPLLSDPPPASKRIPVVTQPSSKQANNLSEPTNGEAKSARQRRNVEKEKEFLASVDQLSEIQLKSVSLPVVDKSLQDHATLYNAIFQNHQSLREVIHDYKKLFLKDTAGIPEMDKCVQAMKEKCGTAQLSIGRKSKYCVQIEYDSQEVSKAAKGHPEDVISALELYNRANKLCKDILERAPNVTRSVQLILDDENGLRKEITKADLDPTVGPQAMKNCVENIGKMRTIPSAMESIQRDTKRIFDEIVKGSKNLFENTEAKLVTTLQNR